LLCSCTLQANVLYQIENLNTTLAQDIDIPVAAPLDLMPISSIPTRRPIRTRRVPAKLRDFVRSETTPIYRDVDSDSEHETPPPSSPMAPSPECLHPLTTKPDDFGVYRVYVDRPSRFPSETETLPSIADSPHFSISKRWSEADPTCVFGPRVVSEATSYKPFDNISTLRAMEAFYGHTELSTKALDEIIAITQTEEFDVSHWEHFSTATQMQRMDKFIASKEAGPDLEGTFGWKRGSVTLRLPAKDVKQREAAAVAFTVEGILYRDLLDVVKSFYGSPTFEEMHLKGFTHMWKANENSDPQQLFGEAFTSRLYLRMEEELRKLPVNPSDLLERVIAPIMFQSDATHLANFGTASLWPCYAFPAAQSKYPRGKPSGLAARHFCYAPSVCCMLDTTARS